MAKLEKFATAFGAIGIAASAAITATVIRNLLNMPSGTMIESKEVSYLMFKCYAPMIIGIAPGTVFGIREAYKDIKNYLFPSF